MHDVLSQLDKHWDWDKLTRNPNITTEDIEPHPYICWNKYWLSDNPNITMDYIKAHPQNWKWDWLSENPNITMKDIISNPDKSWSYYSLSKNPGVTIEDVLAYRNKPWSWENLSSNPGTWIHAYRFPLPGMFRVGQYILHVYIWISTDIPPVPRFIWKRFNKTSKFVCVFSYAL